MKRKTYLYALAMAVGLALSVSGAALAQEAPANVAGTWNLTITTPRGTFNSTLTLKQDGAKVTGTVSSRMGDTAISKGAVSGDTLTFEITRDTPNGTFTMNYKATVKGDDMKGTAGNDRFSMDFTGKRGAASSGSDSQSQ